MNKKFSTLVGCLALGTLFSANAQTVQDAYRICYNFRIQNIYR